MSLSGRSRKLVTQVSGHPIPDSVAATRMTAPADNLKFKEVSRQHGSTALLELLRASAGGRGRYGISRAFHEEAVRAYSGATYQRIAR